MYKANMNSESVEPAPKHAMCQLPSRTANTLKDFVAQRGGNGALNLGEARDGAVVHEREDAHAKRVAVVLDHRQTRRRRANVRQNCRRKDDARELNQGCAFQRCATRKRVYLV